MNIDKHKIKAWFGDEFVQEESGHVTEWKDKSGNGLHAVQNKINKMPKMKTEYLTTDSLDVIADFFRDQDAGKIKITGLGLTWNWARMKWLNEIWFRRV